MTAAPIKPVVWLADTLRTLKTFPSGVQDEVGYALYSAQ
jgi:phage-related protein